MKKLILIFLAAAVFWAAGCGKSAAVSYELGPDAEELPAEGTSGERGNSFEGEAVSGTDRETEEPPESVFVYVCGAVRAPGVYELPEGSRVYEALAAAGGMTEEADERTLNQAGILEDGQQITVYTKEEAASVPSAAGDISGSGKVNLNTAGKELLTTLPGIGEARADAILRYRDENGGFSNIEEIMQIAGIKEKIFEEIRDLIEV